MGSDTKKRQVTFEQLKFLLEFLKEHPILAKGLTRGQRGRLQTLKVWNSCAKLLNVCKNGAIKDGKGWSKYWCDWKYRVRRRALELRAAKESNKPPPDGITQLSAMETMILNIIGNNSVDGVIIKSDPLADSDIHEDNIDDYHYDETGANQANSRRNVEATSSSVNTRKRRNSSKDVSDSDNQSELSSRLPRERKSRVNSVRGEHTVESETDDEASQFLELEREKLEISKRRSESMQTIANELSRLTDVLSHIRDILINNRLNNVI